MTIYSSGIQLAALFDHRSIQRCIKRASAVHLSCVYRAYRHSQRRADAESMHGHPIAKQNSGRTVAEQILNNYHGKI